MHRGAVARGCEQAIIPFSVARSSPSAAHCSPLRDRDATSGIDHHAEPLYLSLQQGEKVRVLRRECHHGTRRNDAPSYALTSVADGVALSLPRWCIAQREDGAIGLVPGSLLQRVPGVLFSPRNAAAVAVHHDCSQIPLSKQTCTPTRRGQHSASEASVNATFRAADVVIPTQATSEKRDSLGDHWPEEDGKVDHGGDRVAGTLQLQRRWQSTLHERLDSFGDIPPTSVPTDRGLCTTASAVPAPIAPRGTENASDMDDSGGCEQLRLMEEEARVRAELHWLTEEVVPRLQAVCTEEQARLEKWRQHPCCRSAADSSSPSGDSASSPNPLADLDREHKRVMGLLERAESLKAGLTRDVLGGAAREPQKSRLSTGSDLAVSSAGCEAGEASTSVVLGAGDLDRGSPGPLKEKDSRCDKATSQGPKAPASHIVGKLRLLVAEETETLDSYRSQRLALQQRLSQLMELMHEVAAEEASLKESETALHRLLGGRTSDLVVDVAWPRTLQGLTDEEEAALRASLHTFDKYTRKLQRITDDGQCGASTNDKSSSADASLSANVSTTSAAAATGAAERSRLSAGTSAAPPDRRLHSNGRASVCESESAVAAPASSRLEHLRKVMEKGDRKLAQLQAKLEAVQQFCDTYSPVAREIEEQLQLGERVLAAKKKYLAGLQVTERGEASTGGL
ncbi:hypothetical protein LSCM1_04849 [Leishmania martiniquensis]|uniref:Uncharacterized protein n=1 Tax=Leishmania martiniquensis TaxID=1580590 RepID=A0A836KQN8_9TRYP|nr:hypothetical protein LSCM1_04849 [Leishmania martiniquensis]